MGKLRFLRAVNRHVDGRSQITNHLICSLRETGRQLEAERPDLRQQAPRTDALYLCDV